MEWSILVDILVKSKRLENFSQVSLGTISNVLNPLLPISNVLEWSQDQWPDFSIKIREGKETQALIRSALNISIGTLSRFECSTGRSPSPVSLQGGYIFDTPWGGVKLQREACLKTRISSPPSRVWRHHGGEFEAADFSWKMNSQMSQVYHHTFCQDSLGNFGEGNTAGWRKKIQEEFLCSKIHKGQIRVE